MKKLLTMILMLAVVFSLAACGGGGREDVSRQSQPTSLADDTSASSADGTTDSSAPEETENPVPEESGLESVSESESTQDESGSEEMVDNDDDNAEQGSNILIAYFSRVGNTEWEDGVDATTSASLNVENGEYVGNAEYLARMAQEVTGGDLFLIETVEPYPSDYRQTTDKASEEQADNARPALASHVENMDAYDTIVLIYPNWWGTLPQPLFTFLEEYDFSGKIILPLCTHGGSRMGSSESDIASLCPDATLLEGLAVSGSSAASAQAEVEDWIRNSGIIK